MKEKVLLAGKEHKIVDPQGDAAFELLDLLLEAFGGDIQQAADTLKSGHELTGRLKTMRPFLAAYLKHCFEPPIENPTFSQVLGALSLLGEWFQQAFRQPDKADSVVADIPRPRPAQPR